MIFCSSSKNGRAFSPCSSRKRRYSSSCPRKLVDARIEFIKFIADAEKELAAGQREKAKEYRNKAAKLFAKDPLIEVLSASLEAKSVPPTRTPKSFNRIGENDMD